MSLQLVTRIELERSLILTDTIIISITLLTSVFDKGLISSQNIRDLWKL